jgi:hypothetical protein
LLDQRQNAFKYGGSGDFETGYFAPDLVQLKYVDRSIEEIGERWIEDGEHFEHTRLIAQITNNSTIGANILIEVY